MVAMVVTAVVVVMEVAAAVALDRVRDYRTQNGGGYGGGGKRRWQRCLVANHT